RPGPGRPGPAAHASRGPDRSRAHDSSRLLLFVRAAPPASEPAVRGWDVASRGTGSRRATWMPGRDPRKCAESRHRTEAPGAAVGRFARGDVNPPVDGRSGEFRRRDLVAQNLAVEGLGIDA